MEGLDVWRQFLAHVRYSERPRSCDVPSVSAECMDRNRATAQYTPVQMTFPWFAIHNLLNYGRLLSGGWSVGGRRSKISVGVLAPGLFAPERNQSQ